MSFEARILTVLIASPSDTADARNLVEGAIVSWNRDRARESKVVLLPLRWEFDAIPELGGDAQSVINRQLVDEADIVFGLFHGRLGRPTSRGASGTVEELERSLARGAKVHVYFSEMPIPHDADPAQLEALHTFRKGIEERGLLGRFASNDDLVAKVRSALERDVMQRGAVEAVGRPPATDRPPGAAPAGVRGPSAILRARYESDREPETDHEGRARMRSRRERLVVENLGRSAASNVRVAIEAVGEGEAPVALEDDLEAMQIEPRGAFAFRLMTHARVASRWRVTFRWLEDGVQFAETQTVTAF